MPLTNKNIKYGNLPPYTHAARKEKIKYCKNKTEGAYNKENEKTDDQKSITSHIYMPRCYAGLGLSHARTGFLRLVD